MTEWISVKDELPTENQQVFIFANYRIDGECLIKKPHAFLVEYKKLGQCKHCHFICDDFLTYRPDFWIPVPGKPK